MLVPKRSHETLNPRRQLSDSRDGSTDLSAHRSAEYCQTYEEEIVMSLYMLRARYNAEAFKAMVANPGNRESAAKAIYSAAGLKLHHLWYTTNGDVIAVAEGNVLAGATLGMAVLASGSFSEGESIELLTMDQMAEAMASAGKISAQYRAPGK